MTHPSLMVWLLLMIRYEFVYVYFIATKNVGDYSYMSSPNIYYRALIYIIYAVFHFQSINMYYKLSRSRISSKYSNALLILALASCNRKSILVPSDLGPLR